MTTYLGIPKCSRCGDAFVGVSAAQRHCIPCGVDVARIIDADTKRRNRFDRAKALDGWRTA